MPTTMNRVEKRRLQPAEVFEAIAQIARPLYCLIASNDTYDSAVGIEMLADVGRFAERGVYDLDALSEGCLYASNALEARLLCARGVLSAIYALVMTIREGSAPARFLEAGVYEDAIGWLGSRLADEYRASEFEGWEFGVMEMARSTLEVA